MLSLPVPKKIDKDFLDGDGSFEFETDNDAWGKVVMGNQPFDRSVDRIANVDLSVDHTKSFSFGRQSEFQLGVSAGANHYVQILFPDRDTDTASEYGLNLSGNNLYARLYASAGASVTGNGSFPLGPVSATFGVAAGGSVNYERWRLWSDQTPARQVLTDLYSGIRLPQHVDEAPKIPAPGELLLTRLSGYLRLNAGLSWGYSVTGSKDIDANQLELALDYKLRMMAAVSFGFKLAGDYQVEARRGSDSNWVRLTVRKSRETETSLAADFAFDGEYELRGLPSSADEFISKLLGTHADRALELFQQARKYSDLDELDQAVGKILKDTVHKYSQEVLNIPLSNETVQEFLTQMRRVTETYQNLDKRILDLYHDFLDSQEEHQKGILSTINLILGQGSREDLVALSGSNASNFGQAVDLLRGLYNERIFNVLREDEAFAEATKLLTRARDFINGDADTEVKEWIDRLKNENPLDGLLKELAKFDTPDKIRGIVDEKLQGLVEQLIGKAFSEIQDSDAGRVAEAVHNGLEKINDFKNKKWKWFMENAVKRSFQINVHLAYTRARRNEKLLDVEINLADANGSALANKAAHGDFYDVLNNYDPNVVHILKGSFSDQLTKTTEVKLNILGWKYHDVVTLFLDADHAIDAQNGGLLHVYTSGGYVERKRKSGRKFTEELHSKFLIQALGETFQPEKTAFRRYAIDTLKSMTADYSLMHRDQKTKTAELVQYLGLAKEIGLLDRDPRDYADEMLATCGGDLGEVRVDYSVQFNANALQAAFLFSGDALKGLARNALRRFIMLSYAGKGLTSGLPPIGFAYAAPTAYEWHRNAELLSKLKAVKLPVWFTGDKKPTARNLTSAQVALVDHLFKIEDTFVEALSQLDTQVDLAKAGQTIDSTKLNNAMKKYLESVKDLTGYDSSTMAVMMDHLIQVGSGGTMPRDSVVLIEATPREGPVAGQKITRMLTTGPKNPEVLATDEDTAPAEPAEVGAVVGA